MQQFPSFKPGTRSHRNGVFSGAAVVLETVKAFPEKLSAAGKLSNLSFSYGYESSVGRESLFAK